MFAPDDRTLWTPAPPTSGPTRQFTCSQALWEALHGLVTVEDAPRTHGFGAEVVARVASLGFGALRAAPRRVAARDVPLSYNSALENAALPNLDDVVDACRGALGIS